MIKTILFDVDGVLLSEEHYFDASGLTVWELLISENYLGLLPQKFKTDYNESEIKQIREHVFGESDEVLKFQKSRGLNANWDMIYLSFGHQLLHLLSQIKGNEYEKIKRWLSTRITRETLMDIGRVLKGYTVEMDFSLFVKDFNRSTAAKQELLGYLDDLAKEKLGVETEIFKSKEGLWSICEHVSQEWYVGDDNVMASTGRPSVQLGKKGFLANETTLASSEQIGRLFRYLTESGFMIGIGTGRPALETILPFQHLDWLKNFDEKRIVTADDVLKAEDELKSKKSLSKPHPFTYVMAISGNDTPSIQCLQTELPLRNGEEILIVGDSLADLLAARQMGAKFAAVLTGLSGKDARGDFEEQKADYILDSVLNVKEIV